MTVDELLDEIAKPATKFQTGGFRPENGIDQSWIGKVCVFGKDETIPTDAEGNSMLPLAQFYLPGLPSVPAALGKTKLLTVFISKNLPEQFSSMGSGWMIREYVDLENIEIVEQPAPGSFIKPFPLKPEYVAKDYPLWDNGGLSHEQFERILGLEEEGVIESYYDIIDHTYHHKIGGYPSFCQSGVDFGEGFEFVFQISSDQKAQLNIVDNGSLMFAKNRNNGQWAIYYDFY